MGRRGLWRRTSPYLALAAIQLSLISLIASQQGSISEQTTAGGTEGIAATALDAADQSADAGASVASGVAASSDGSDQATQPGALGQRPVAVSEAGPWPWTHPWSLPGDRSRCAPGGKLQQNITLFSPPCVPAYTGPNGGATAPGVTATTITIVRYRTQSNPAYDALLASAGLSEPPSTADPDLQAWGDFFAKHYEFYGRKIKWILFQGNCPVSPPDITCFRNEARTIKTQHNPFIVFDPGGVPGEFYDELGRLSIINIGGWHFSSDFDVAHRPYHWDYWMDGTLTARNVADYYCKKMAGKLATRAGDPRITSTKRKMGILAREGRDYGDDALVLAGLVSGGECGSAADKPPVITFQQDISRYQEQMTAIVTAFKRAGVTTVVCLCDLTVPAFLTRAADTQQWFPEHLMSGAGGTDYDFAGRLYSSTQWRNAFGPSHLSQFAKESDQDHFKAWNDVRTSGEPCSSCLLMFWYQHFAALMVQNAGPTLTPATVERGMLESQQMGGWANSTAWPGWSCCNAYLQEWKFGPGDYTANQDSKEVYWDPSATSPLDGEPGAYICVAKCRRTEVGSWPTTDPLT